MAFEHCIAKEYKQTNWEAILSIYDQMLLHKFDPVVYLNRCIALMEANDTKKALAAMEEMTDNKYLQKYYLFYSAKAEMFKRLGMKKKASNSLKRALSLVSSSTEKKILQDRLDTL